MIDLKGFYQRSERFRGYVDRCAANSKVTTEEILSHALTWEVAQSYMGVEPRAAVASAYAPMGECT